MDENYSSVASIYSSDLYTPEQPCYFDIHAEIVERMGGADELCRQLRNLCRRRGHYVSVSWMDSFDHIRFRSVPVSSYAADAEEKEESTPVTEIETSHEMTVRLVRSMAADEYVVQAAQVSAKGETEIEELVWKYQEGKLDIQRFIDALLLPRHGVPFEHCYYTFFVEVPIFVARQWHKHRMSSTSEMSGRYKVLPEKFYVPDNDRPIVNAGTKMKPRFIPAHSDLQTRLQNTILESSSRAAEAYHDLLDQGVAEEIARAVLPVNIYTQFYWTVNARSLMNFLAQRIESPDSRVPSHPQYEIDDAAQEVEAAFANTMPATFAAFLKAGRVAP